MGQEGDTGGDDLSRQCWKVQALPVCLARWATVTEICEEANHQLGQGERFYLDSPGQMGYLSGTVLATLPVFTCVAERIPEPRNDLDKGLFGPILPNKQSFVFATQLENKLDLKPGTDTKAPCCRLLSVGSREEGTSWLPRGHKGDGKRRGVVSFKNSCNMGSSMSFELSIPI